MTHSFRKRIAVLNFFPKLTQGIASVSEQPSANRRVMFRRWWMSKQCRLGEHHNVWTPVNQSEDVDVRHSEFWMHQRYPWKTKCLKSKRSRLSLPSILGRWLLFLNWNTFKAWIVSITKILIKICSYRSKDNEMLLWTPISRETWFDVITIPAIRIQWSL